MSGEPAKYEMIEWEGKPARYYPQSGAVMQPDDHGRMVFVANFGGNPLMQDPEYAREMQRRKIASYYEAIAEGLIRAGEDLKLQGSGHPSAIITEIIRKRAMVATEPTRDGNDAAKFIFSVIRQSEEKEQEENVIKFQLTEAQMGDVLGKIFKDE